MDTHTAPAAAHIAVYSVAHDHSYMSYNKKSDDYNTDTSQTHTTALSDNNYYTDMSSHPTNPHASDLDAAGNYPHDN
jgi:hypothetical protein